MKRRACLRVSLSALATGLLIWALAPGAGIAAASHRVAFLASSSENGFNQAIWEGIKKRAAELGIEAEIFNGEFNAEKQNNQVEDLVASRKFDGIILEPNDSVGIANALKDAIAANIKVVVTLFPVGPKLDTLEPQIPGLTATVASNPAVGAKVVADQVVKYCEGKDPCNVIVIVGQKIYPFDNLRYQTELDTFKSHPNIKLVGTVEGGYDPDKTMTGVQNVLQGHKDVDAMIAMGDQMMVGAELAAKDAGLDTSKMLVIGGGASEIGIKAIRDGRWTASIAFFPVTMGEYAVQALADTFAGKQVNPVVDSDKIGPLPALVTKAELDAHPDFKGEWAQ
ncbi:MAG TPA: sugar ABC transporter substrate-binding protein [Roseiarcus sp.]|jgi:ribose transport system substrate-binding protein